MAIYWFLNGNKKVASARIHGINIHRYLLTKSIASYLVHTPYGYNSDLFFNKLYYFLFYHLIDPSDIVVIQKLNDKKSLDLVKNLKERNVTILFIDSDLPVKKNISDLADKIITPSSNLMKLYQKEGYVNIEYIPDAIEKYLKPIIKNDEKIFTAVWFGFWSKKRSEEIKKIKREVFTPLKNSWKLITISNSNEADYKWDKKSFSLINSCDVAIIPTQNTKNDFFKSYNRASQSMALGIPVIAGDIPSYHEIIDQGKNGFILNDDPVAWRNTLQNISSERQLKQLKLDAYRTATGLGIDIIGPRWIKMFHNLNNKSLSSKVKLWKSSGVVLLRNLILLESFIRYIFKKL